MSDRYKDSDSMHTPAEQAKADLNRWYGKVSIPIQATHVWINYRMPGDSQTRTAAFTNVPISVVEEAVAHINDNSGGN